MPKPFLSQKEKETILSAYSRNFEKEFEKIGPYTFGVPYLFQLSICPEVDYEGKKTGRILVNHFRYSSTKIPEFIDVWERDDEGLHLVSRNLPGRNLVSEGERVKVLEEELKAYQRLDKMEGEIIKLKGKQLLDYALSQQKELNLLREEINRAYLLIHSWREDADSYFKESPYYWELLKERDEALAELFKLREKNDKLDERLKSQTDKLLSVSSQLAEQAERSKPFTHNARGAGRKKDPVVDIKKEKVKKLLNEGKGRFEIMKELGISKSTYYRYVKDLEKK